MLRPSFVDLLIGKPPLLTGNLIRTPEGKICILDFGMMTEITKLQRENLVEYIANITMEDWEGVAISLKHLGFIPAGAPDPREAGLIEPLRIVFSQMKKGGGVKKFRELRKNPEKLKEWRKNAEIAKVAQDLEDLSKKYPFKIPSFFALILRAFSVIEGIALGSDPDYAIVQECFPYLSKRLLTDNSPRTNKILRGLLYGSKQRMNVERFRTLTTAMREFTVDGLRMEDWIGEQKSVMRSSDHTSIVRKNKVQFSKFLCTRCNRQNVGFYGRLFSVVFVFLCMNILEPGLRCASGIIPSVAVTSAELIVCCDGRMVLFHSVYMPLK